MKNARTIIAALAVILAAAAVAAFSRAPAPRARVIKDSDRLRARIAAQVASSGTAAAYAEIKKESAGDDVATRHGMGHIFGEVAFAKDGIDGIKVCDADLSFGCFHGLIVKALVTDGLGGLGRIDAACTSAYGRDDTGCRHGIGHGLVEYFGPRDLADALKECATLRPPGLLGCTQGAFMEYADAAADEPALADEARPDMPCAAAAAEFRPSCYFEQPYFWRLRLGYGSGDVAAGCAGLADAAERRACLLGFGRSAAELGGYRDGDVAAACGTLAPEDRPACFAGAHWLYAALGKTEPVPSFCDASGDAAACRAAAATIR